MPSRRLTYREIADDLTARIAAGEWGPPGSPLPTYRQLAETYGVSYSTASKAVSILTDRGVIYGETGRGLFRA